MRADERKKQYKTVWEFEPEDGALEDTLRAFLAWVQRRREKNETGGVTEG
jgi:hypothetical protein